ncbi:hypothetical protein A9D12_10190 [Erythrobacter neustonensis]|uniref:Uncharacterized protein n=1 Tax=Erythrobacter neustonensis TaxID=1112 RepID=A0A192D593_9SPHN|nr:hypothetical protein A9D12_10190 [Erythrobacter neustonensis]
MAKVEQGILRKLSQAIGNGRYFPVVAADKSHMEAIALDTPYRVELADQFDRLVELHFEKFAGGYGFRWCLLLFCGKP